MTARNGKMEINGSALPAKKEANGSAKVADVTDGDERDTWGNQCEFFLSCLGYAVGFGNVWRFPYLAFKNGGAVFLIPYVIMLLLAGLPLFFMELSLGQYISLGPNILFPKLAPIFSGLGWAMLVVSALVAIYYNMILAYTLFYTFASFTSVLPWSHCNNNSTTAGCYTGQMLRECEQNNTIVYQKSCWEKEDICGLRNFTLFNETHCINDMLAENATGYWNEIGSVAGSISASEDYFKNRMLGLDGKTWDDMGGMRWEIVGCLALAWVIVCCCMIKGVKSSGKVVYFTALFPYAVLFILFIRGVTLEGAYKGVRFYFLEPDFERLKDITVWSEAATQIFYSLGPSFGGLITLASYNKFKNNCMRDAIVIALSNCATSVFAGFVIFSILGFMATNANKEISEVVASGSGLAFVVYPEAVTQMPVAPLWSLLFFTMLITLGLDSQFTMVETLTTAIFDAFPNLRKRKPIVVIGMCVCLFACGLTMCLEGGYYMFELFNAYTASISLVILSITEVVAVQYVYGFKRFINGIIDEIGVRIRGPFYWYWAATWTTITPLTLLFILIFSIVNWQDLSYAGYVFPRNIQGLGWCLCFCSVILLPIFAGIEFYKNRKNNKDIKDLFRPSPKFVPAYKRKLLTQDKTQGVDNEDVEGHFRYTYDNEGFQEPVVQIYPKIPSANGTTEVPEDRNNSYSAHHM